MNTVTLSKEYKLIFPEEIHEAIGLKAGTSFEVISYNNRIELIPVKPIKNLNSIIYWQKQRYSQSHHKG